jgi:hypothetical protein
MAGDFNVVLEEGGTNKDTNKNSLTEELLPTILMDNCLGDLGVKTNNRKQTQYQR